MIINFVKEKNDKLVSDGVNLVIGWSLAKEFGASIRNHKISENLYWTFSENEKRKEYEVFMKEIYSIAYKNMVKQISVKNLNPLEYNTVEDYQSTTLKAVSGGLGYLFDDRLYTYKEKEIFHIDVGLLKFMSWDIINDILDNIELSEEHIDNFKEDLKYLDIKYIPYLIYAKQNDTISNVC